MAIFSNGSPKQTRCEVRTIRAPNFKLRPSRVFHCLDNALKYDDAAYIHAWFTQLASHAGAELDGKRNRGENHHHFPFHLLKGVPDFACGKPGDGNLFVQVARLSTKLLL